MICICIYISRIIHYPVFLYSTFLYSDFIQHYTLDYSVNRSHNVASLFRQNGHCFDKRYVTRYEASYENYYDVKYQEISTFWVKSKFHILKTYCSNSWQNFLHSLEFLLYFGYFIQKHLY